MYVSSFGTYITADSSTKAHKGGVREKTDTSSSFETALLSKTIKNIDTSAKFPINYISNYKALNNQQKLQEKSHESAQMKFSKMEAQNSAQSAYSDNSTLFSLISEPNTTLNQTPKVDKTLPLGIQNIQKENLRHTMINTYVSNENYYRITA